MSNEHSKNGINLNTNVSPHPIHGMAKNGLHKLHSNLMTFNQARTHEKIRRCSHILKQSSASLNHIKKDKNLLLNV